MSRRALGRAVPVLLMLGVATSFLGTLGFLYEKSEARPITYKTETPFVTDIIKKTVVPGALVPRREIAIKAHVSGVIEKLLVEPGQPVKAGALIAKIRVMPNMVQVNAAEMQVRAAQIGLENAGREAERFARLYREGLVSQTEFNQYELADRLRGAELDAAESNRDLMLQGSSTKSTRVANVVTATAGGTVLDVPVKEGSSVIEANTFNEGTTIASVADMDDLIFQGRVDESDVGRIREGMTVSVAVGALGSEHLNAQLEYIAPKGVEKDGTIGFEVKAALTQRDGVRIRDNYSATGDIILDQRTQVLAVRESWLEYERNEAYVEVETAPARLERRKLELGLSDGLNVQVLSGISASARVKTRAD